MPSPAKVLFLVPYPLHRAPSQRFRVENFLPFLDQQGIEYKLAPFLDEATFSILYSNASAIRKGLGVLKGFLKRLYLLLFAIHRYDYVFVHREASPLGPPIFEFLAAKVFRKKLIYDFDDAIWIADSTNKALNWVKAYWKVRHICSWAHTVVGGNEYLCNYARQYNANVVLIPSCVDVERQHNKLKDQDQRPLTLGWTGSHSTLKYLDRLVPQLSALAARGVRILIICNKPPAFHFEGLQFVQWKEETEIDDLLQMNIGIMPLEEDAWSKGKCGFKLIQYLSLGIPAIASPVGVNQQIIEEGKNGFLATTIEQWQQAIDTLVDDEALRKQMGTAGRSKIEKDYSIQAYETVFAGLFSDEGSGDPRAFA